MKKELKKIHEQLSECLDSLEKYPVIASYYIGAAQTRIEILLESMEDKEEDDG